jgi:hypothetical protein
VPSTPSRCFAPASTLFTYLSPSIRRAISPARSAHHAATIRAATLSRCAPAWSRL